MMIPIMNFHVQKCQVGHVLKDVAGLNPKDAEKLGDHITIAIGEKRLVLPTFINSRISPSYISLNMEQRKFLEVKERDVVEVREESDISPIKKLVLLVTYQFFRCSYRLSSDQVPEIQKIFRATFTPHVLNKGHRISLKVGDTMLSLQVINLYNSSGKEVKCGLFDSAAEIKIQLPMNTEV